MTPTPHGQVPEALRLAEQYDHGDPAAHGNAWKAAVCTELRRLAELEAQIEALSGVQALSAAPAGWKLVPEDATEEMVRATDKVNFANADTDGTMHNVWNVMLAASPPPTSPAEQQAPSAAAADTVVLEAALRAIHQAIDLIGEPDTERLRTVRRVLRGAVIVAEDAGEAATAPQPAPHLPERDASLPAERQGLFRKFVVGRVDGSDKPGGKHHGCTYFVLDVDHDPCARPALAAYAAACESTHPTLAADLRTKWGVVPAPQPVVREPLTDEQLAEMMRDTWGCASIAPRHAPEFARAVERAHGIAQKGGS